MANLIVIASDLDQSATRTQRFVDCGIIGGEAIVGRSDVFDQFFGFFSEGGRHSSGGDW